MKRTAIAVLTLLLVTGSSKAQGNMFEIAIKAGDQDLKNVPVCVPLSLPELRGYPFGFVTGKGIDVYGQLTDPGLLTADIKQAGEKLIRKDVHFILPEIKKGTTQVLQFKPFPGKRVTVKFKTPFFHWQDGKESFDDLERWDADGKRKQPILRYMHAAYDDSTPDARNKTYKPFHHLFDPSGKHLVTNGGHTDSYDDPKKLLYPHHRGLMYGFNKISYDGGKTADTWHCPPADPKKKRTENYTEHVKTLRQEAGPVLGRHRVLIDWHGSKTDIFAKEEREVTAYAVPGGTLVEFASLLKTTGAPVKLDGDPQHAGFQFRATNEVAEKTSKQTYFLRLGGKGKPGETINWDVKKLVPGTEDIPWKGMSFVVGGKRYTVAYLDHPDNPRPTRHSERDYGRLGGYFSWELAKERPLLVHYRIWLQDGEMTADQVTALLKAFIAPPKVTVKEVKGK